jgi:hypothetical protein
LAGSWLTNLDPYNGFIAQPLHNNTVDPTLFDSSIQPYHSNRPFHEPRISPSMLHKSIQSPSTEVKWYSGGKEVVSKTPPKRRSRESTQDKRTPLQVENSIPWIVNVDTGLDTVKRIKLIFREGAASSSSRPNSSDSAQLAIDGERLTPPAAKGEEERELPLASELDLDENTPPPEKRRSDDDISVVIPKREIKRELYPVLLARDAKQTMIKNKSTGMVKGVIFDWDPDDEEDE